MASGSTTLRLPAAAVLLAIALVALDVVDSARTVVVLGGYVWCAAFIAAALCVAFRTLRSGLTDF